MSGIIQGLIASFGGAVKDAYYNLVTLLLNTGSTNGAQNNTFLDSSSNNFSITRNGNTTQGTFTPFSQTGWAFNFNGSTDYLTVTDTANLRFGSSNFTIEAWVYRAASGAIQTIVSKGAATPTGYVFQISAANKLVFIDTSTSITGTTTLAANTWYYVAVVRAGTGASQTTLYVNGTSDATGTSATTFNQTDNLLVGADRSSLNFFNGYISNLRLSNTNRTITSTPTSALTADANTIFLSANINRFQYTDSTATFTNMAVTGTPSVQAFSPFAPTAAYSTTTVGGSGYFDGTGDSLSIANNASFNFGTGDFTVEFWFYAVAPAADSRFISNDAYNQVGIDISWESGSSRISWYIAATPYVIPLPARNAWHHVAWTRSGTTLRTYINGAIANTYTGVSTNITTTNQLIIGGYYTGANETNAYMSGVRLLKGTALYTGSTYTIPTAPLTNITNTSLLLNFTNAGIFDSAAKNDLETVDNAQVSTTQAKFGTTSIAFDGNGDYLSLAARPVLNVSGGRQFTVECWIYTSSTARQNVCIDTAYAQYWDLCIDNLKVNFRYNNAVVSITSSASITSGAWNHIAICWTGSAMRIFINGTMDSANSATSMTSHADAIIILGYSNFSPDPQWMNGYIDDFRITNGFARYTANFTAPTAAFPVQ